jgi:hypothetical protein
MTIDHCRYAHDSVGHAPAGLPNSVHLPTLDGLAHAAAHDAADFGPAWESDWIDLGGEG